MELYVAAFCAGAVVFCVGYVCGMCWTVRMVKWVVDAMEKEGT